MLRPIVVAALIALTALPAWAADPASGTLSDGNRTLEYRFDVAPAPNASGLTGVATGTEYYTCDAANPCDEFELTVDLPADYTARHPDVLVRVSAATDVEYLDIDLQVVDAERAPVAIMRDNPPEQPDLVFFPDAGTHKFYVQVAPGTPHSGGAVTITLEPGEEAKVLGVFSGAWSLAGLAPLACFLLIRRRRKH